MKEGHGHARSYSSVPLLPYADATPPATPFVFAFHPKHRVQSFVHRRRPVFVVVAILSVVSLALLASWAVTDSSGPRFAPQETDPLSLPSDPEWSNITLPELHFDDVVPVSEYPPYIVGAPTQSFRDNLRNDTKYITSWLSAGWSTCPLLIVLDVPSHIHLCLDNDVMTYMNLIYLGIITDRVPVVAMFTPSHIGGDAPVITFGEVFDVPRFREESGVPLLEWTEVKDPESDVVDELGCWNIWESVQYYEHAPRGSSIPDWLGLGAPISQAFTTKTHLLPQIFHILVHRNGSNKSPIMNMTNAARSGHLPVLLIQKTGTRTSETHSLHLNTAQFWIPMSTCFATTICITLALLR